jgi:glutaconate CoA-transferase, subunit B
MNKAAKIKSCTLGELMIYQIALSIEDGILAFHGFGTVSFAPSKTQSCA